VWVDGWQMECCGDPFAVGSTIAWRVSRVPDDDFLGSVLGTGEASEVTASYEHHGDREQMAGLTGVVRRIRAVFCDYGIEAPEAKVARPVAGTGSTTELDAVDRGGVSELGPDGLPRLTHRFVGYLVDLEDPVD
jgi:hypothetical protein